MFTMFQYPTGSCLGRGVPPAPIKGCSNKRWKDNDNERVTDRQQLRRAFGNYIINDIDTPYDWANNLAQLPQVNNLLPGGTPRASNSCISEQAGFGAFAACTSGTGCWGVPGILTPFRRAMNAGDPYGKVDSVPSSTITPKPSNQVQGSRRASNQAAASTAGNGRQTVQGGSAYTGNPKQVYDSSDYIRYKKLLAKNNNYNDPTFGGDMHNASQVPLSRVRRGISGI